MLLATRPRPAPQDLSPNRRRLAVGWAVTASVLLVGALVVGLVMALGPDDDATERSTLPRTTVVPTFAPAASDEERQDAIASAPMVFLPAAAANPHALLPASGAAVTFAVPEARRTAGIVGTGFPQTVAGAVAQFVAIDEAAIEGMNPSQVRQVYADWAVPGAEPVDLWSVSQFVQQTLNASGVPDGSSNLQAAFAVTEAQVKGTVGDDWVLACVNGEFSASLLANSVRIGAADCARMVWTGARWQIGAGTQPAVPPNAWPGTAEARDAGWRPISRG